MFPAYAHLSAYDRHKKLMNDYFQLNGGSISSLKRDNSRDKRDFDVIRENHKFLWNEETDATDTWEKRLAKKYYDKLFKEYCICDMTFYKQNKVALRWRIEKEVVTGKGQFICGNKYCNQNENLRSWEVNFGYVEHGEKVNALVKLRLCQECSDKLNYHSKKREVKRGKSLKRLGEKSTSDATTSAQSPSRLETETGEDHPTCSDSSNKTETEQQLTTKPPEDSDKNPWLEKQQEPEEKSREQEFEAYLENLFL